MVDAKDRETLKNLRDELDKTNSLLSEIGDLNFPNEIPTNEWKKYCSDLNINQINLKQTIKQMLDCIEEYSEVLQRYNRGEMSRDWFKSADDKFRATLNGFGPLLRHYKNANNAVQKLVDIINNALPAAKDTLKNLRDELDKTNSLLSEVADLNLPNAIPASEWNLYCSDLNINQINLKQTIKQMQDCIEKYSEVLQRYQRGEMSRDWFKSADDTFRATLNGLRIVLLDFTKVNNAVQKLVNLINNAFPAERN